MLKLLILCLLLWSFASLPPTSAASTTAERQQFKDFCTTKAIGVYAPTGISCPDFYILCNGETTTIQRCLPGMVFSEAEILCNPAPTECQDSVTSQPQLPEQPQQPVPQQPQTPQTHTQKPRTQKRVAPGNPGGSFVCPQPDGDFASGDCSRTYFTCRSNTLTKNVCNLGLVFNSVLDLCTKPHQVFGCGKFAQCGKNEVFNDCGSACPSTCSNPGPVACTRQCVIGCFCAPGFTRNDANTCIPVNQCPSIHVLRFNCPQDDGNFPLRSNICGQQFIECNDGNPTMQSCDPGMTFDASVGQCRPITDVTECEFECDGLDNGMYGLGCSAEFWWCWNGKATKHACPKNTFFDAISTKCLFREEVSECTGNAPTTARPTVKTTTEISPITCPKGVFREYADPRDGCVSHFYKCHDGTALRQECPGSSLVYDPANNMCNWRTEVAACEGRLEPESTVSTMAEPTEEPTEGTKQFVFVCPKPEGDFEDEMTVCSPYYWWCEDGNPHYTGCDGLQIFNPRTGLCDDRINVIGCENSNPEDDEMYGFGQRKSSESIPIIEEPDVDCSKDGDVPEPSSSCAPHFYTCLGGVANKKPCPFALFYRHDENRCDYKKNVPGCAPKSSKMVRKTRFVCPKPTGEFEDENTVCSPYFWWCEDMKAKYSVCEGEQIFNPAEQQCDDRTNVQGCENSNPKDDETYGLPPRKIAKPEQPTYPIDCSSLGSGDYKDPENDCAPHFFTCRAGSTFRQLCVEGLIYDASRKRCDWPNQVVGCGGGTASKQTQFVCPRDNGKFDVVDQVCSPYFWWCEYGTAKYSRCNDPQIFNNELQDCDDRANLPECDTPDEPQKQTNPVPTRDPRCDNRPDGQYPLGDCEESFLFCTDGFGQEQACGAGNKFRFSSSGAFCDFPQNVPGCPEYQAPQPNYTQRPQTPTDLNFCAGRLDGDYPSVGVCSVEFHRCYNNQDTLLQCTDPTRFSKRTRTCINPAYVPGCPEYTSTPPQGPANSGSKDIMDPTDPCYRKPEGTTYTAQPQCSQKYYRCRYSSSFPQLCPEGEVFLVSEQQCRVVPECKPTQGLPQLPQNPQAQKGQRPQEQQEPDQDKRPQQPSNPGQSTGDCTGRDDGDYAAGLCSVEFIQCSNGQIHRRSCGVSTVFSESKGYCDYPHNVPGCGTDTPAPEKPIYPGKPAYTQRPTYTRPTYTQNPTNPPYSQKTRPPTYPQKTRPPTYPQKTRPPTYPQQTRPPTYPQQTRPPTYPQKTRPPTYPQKTMPPIYPQETRLPTYPQQTRPPTYPQKTRPPTYPQQTRPPTYPQKTRPPIYPQKTRPPTYPQQTRPPTYTQKPQEPQATYPPAKNIPITVPDLCVTRKEGSRYTLEVCSAMYCECRGRKSVILKCQPGHVFDNDRQRCIPRGKMPKCFEPSLPSADDYCNGAVDGSRYSFDPCTNVFCECKNQMSIFKVCRPGTTYSQNTGECVIPSYNPGCSQATTAAPSQPSPTEFCIGELDGSRYSLEHCSNKYCECLGGKSIFKNCPHGLIYHVQSGDCVSRFEDPKCYTPTTLAPTAPSEPPTNEFCSGQPDGFKYTLKSCSKMYCECLGGKSIYKNCPGRRVFQSLTGDCVPKSQESTCLKPVTKTVAVIPSQQPTIDFCSGQPDGSRYTLKSCSKMYCECLGEKSIFKNCPGRRVFHRGTGLCVPKSEDPTCSPPVTTTVAAPPTEFCEGRVDGSTYTLKICSRMYCECSGGKSIYKNCPKNQVYQRGTGNCVPKSEDETCAEFQPSEKPPADICEGQPNGARYSREKCSRRYFECHYGKSFSRNCQRNLVYQRLTGKCVGKGEEPTCGSQEGPKSPKGGGQRPFEYCAGHKDGSRYTLRDCSNMFSECQSQRSVFMNCPTGQVYQPNLGLCVDPSQEPKCLQATSSTGGKSPVPRIQDLCARQPDGARYSLESCSRTYCECNNGKSIFKTCCPENVFDKDEGECVKRESLGSLCIGGDKGSGGISKRPYYTNRPSYTTQPGYGGYTSGSPNNGKGGGNSGGGYGGRGNGWGNGGSEGNGGNGYGNGGKGNEGKGQGNGNGGSSGGTGYGNGWNGNNGNQGSTGTGGSQGGNGNQNTGGGTGYGGGYGGDGGYGGQKPGGGKGGDGGGYGGKGTEGGGYGGKGTGGDGGGGYGGQGGKGTGAAILPQTKSCQGLADGYYRHPNACSKFIQCYYGKRFDHVCAPGLVFNPAEDVSVCDWPNNVPGCTLEDVGGGKADDPECKGVPNGTFFRHAKDCTKYFRCVHGRRVDLDCPKTTVFNTQLDVCDWPRNVPECGGTNPTFSPSKGY